MSTRNPAPDGTEEAARPRTKLPIPPACDICRQSATALAAGIRRRDFSVREVAAAFLERIEAVNPLVNAIVSLRDPADVLAEAEAADARLVRGEPTGSLFGLPIAIKDLALTTGLKTTFGSPIFADFVPGEDDIFVERMRRAGAIFIGKTNVPEFGLGSNTYNPVFGPTLNGPCAMGYVAKAHSAPGTQLNLIVRGKPLPAVVATMPFVPNGYKR